MGRVSSLRCSATRLYFLWVFLPFEQRGIASLPMRDLLSGTGMLTVDIPTTIRRDHNVKTVNTSLSDADYMRSII